MRTRCGPSANDDEAILRQRTFPRLAVDEHGGITGCTRSASVPMRDVSYAGAPGGGGMPGAGACGSGRGTGCDSAMSPGWSGASVYRIVCDDPGL